MVKLSPQNQLYLNVKKPCRVRISASMLEEKVSGFKAGIPCVLKVNYREKRVCFYHGYEGGDVWVPSAPREVGRHNDVVTIDVARLDTREFIEGMPELTLRNQGKLAWMADEITVTQELEGERVRLKLNQIPAIEGFHQAELLTEIVRQLDVKNRIGFVELSFPDVYQAHRRISLNSDGNHRSFLGVLIARGNMPIRFASFDGVRLRVLYEYFKGLSTTTTYLKSPSLLYGLGEMNDAPSHFDMPGAKRTYLIDHIEPLRALELNLLKHGTNYEVGRVGAEIAYSVIRERFGCKSLVLSEPAKGGKDLYSTDGLVAVQSRLLSHPNQRTLKWQIRLELSKMIRKLGVDFRYTKTATVGYAVLSYVKGGEIQSLIAEVEPKRRKERAAGGS